MRLMGESAGISATSPRYFAPSSVSRMDCSASPPFSAVKDTARPSWKVMVKFSISAPPWLSGSEAASVPSALKRSGAVKTSSVGMLGTKLRPSGVRLAPPSQTWFFARPTVKSVPRLFL